ncbi:hypothetical protein [uncultured Agrococcus sp.]|uniref:hypothetical protein n=1 Tax=uncultured Agrococcus sp. TaxID=382258 RepID=UPI0025FF4FC6|nr:hypothetical protein [uncultured Agrococcus sp.]
MSTDTVESESPVRPKRARYRVINSIVVGVASLAALFTLLQVATTVTGRALLTFGGADGRLPLVQLPQLMQADHAEGGSGTLADLDLSMRVLGASPMFVQAVVFVVATIGLVRIVSGISRAQPFSDGVQSNWKLLTTALLGGGLLQAALETAAWMYFSSRIGLLFGAGLGITREEQEAFLGGDYSAIAVALPNWPLTIIVAGLVTLALTAAFRIGARLEREADGVV